MFCFLMLKRSWGGNIIQNIEEFNILSFLNNLITVYRFFVLTSYSVQNDILKFQTKFYYLIMGDVKVFRKDIDKNIKIINIRYIKHIFELLHPQENLLIPNRKGSEKFRYGKDSLMKTTLQLKVDKFWKLF